MRQIAWFCALLIGTVLLAPASAPTTVFADPASVVIGSSSTPPQVDGTCNSTANEYADASTVQFFSAGYPVQVRIKHTDTDVYVCMSGLIVPTASMRDSPNAVVYIHRVDESPTAPNSDTFAFSISYNGRVQAMRGGRSGYISYTLGGFSFARYVDNELPQWSAELRISGSLLGGWSRNIRLGFAQQSVNAAGDEYTWPGEFSYQNPRTWAIGQLTTTSAPSTLDLRAVRMVVTQSIQSQTTNNVPLVAGKRTFVRVFATTNEPGYRSNNVTARLSGWRGSTLLGTLLPLNAGGAINIRVRPNPTVINDAFLFELPNGWTASGNLNLSFGINPLHNPSESTYDNNGLGLTTFTFQAQQPLKIVLRNIEYTPRNNRSTTVRAREFDLDMFESWVRRAYPINRLDSVRRTLAFIGGGPLTDDIAHAAGFVNGLLAVNRVVEGDRRRVQVGMVTDQGGFMRGLSPWIPADEVATPTGGGNWGWDFDGSYGDWYGAHELGHALGRPHVGRVFGGDIGCGADWNIFQEAYPYDHGQIGGPDDLPFDFWGFDAGDAGLGLPRGVIPPTWTDMMSYCPNQWISDFSYTRLRNSINERFPTARTTAQARNAVSIANAAVPQAASGDFLVLYGDINTVRQTATIPIISREALVNELPQPSSGPYALQLRNGSAVLSSQSFTPLTNTESIDQASFVQVVPMIAGARQITLFSQRANRVIATVDISANTPGVAGVTHNGGSILPTSGTTILSWNGSDADGDELTYSVKYSFDSKATWRMLAAGIKQQSYAVDTSQLEGTNGASSGFLRVTANDGVNTGVADSAAFAVAGKAPSIRIANPANDSVYGYGQLVGLEAIAQDFEDGSLGDANITWTSNVDGPLGTGALHHEAMLSPGKHVITATARDANGQQSSASVKIEILADTSLKANSQPTLENAPHSMVFIGRAGASAPPSQTVSVRNLDGASLNWQAISGASWLTVTPNSGTTDDDLTVAVDTTGMRSGETRSTTITLAAPGAEGSPQTILVVVQMEGSNMQDPRTPPLRVYLPRAQR